MCLRTTSIGSQNVQKKYRAPDLTQSLRIENRSFQSARRKHVHIETNIQFRAVDIAATTPQPDTIHQEETHV
jgi:hypothetical protein